MSNEVIVFLIPVLLLAGVVIFRRRILASRPARVAVAIGLLPVILFCGYGFLASFEGSDASFVAFRVGYAVVATVLGGGAVFLVFGRVPSMAGGR